MAEPKRNPGVVCGGEAAAPPPTTSWTEGSQKQQQLLLLDVVTVKGGDTTDSAAARDNSTRSIKADLPKAAANEGQGRAGQQVGQSAAAKADDEHQSDGRAEPNGAAAEQFVSRCLHKLQNRNLTAAAAHDGAGGASSDSLASVAKPPAEEGTSECSTAEVGCSHVSDYCSNKLTQLRRRRRSGSSRVEDTMAGPSTAEMSERRSPQTKTGKRRKARAKSGAAVQLPAEFKRKLNRMRIENLLHNLSEACKVQLHDPNRCRKCSKRLSEESRERFLQRHRARLESALVASRYESHLTRAAPVAAIGEIAAQLPRLGDPPADTWDRLMRTAKQTTK